MKALFAIGSSVNFGRQTWEVFMYHKTGKVWNVMFQRQGKFRSVPLVTLEGYVN